MEYNKLIRDKIPEIIKGKNKTLTTHIADEEEYRKKLYEKLKEETDEFLNNPSDEELADILEVIYSISDKKNVEIIRKKKLKERGGFKNRIILEKVED